MTHETMQRIFDATQKTPTEIADAINTKPQNINNWIKRGISKVGAMEIGKAFGLSVDWILTGEGTMTTPALQSNINPQFREINDWTYSTPLEGDEIEVPFYKDFAFACGHGAVGVAYSNEWHKLRINRRIVDRIGSNRDMIFATTADGDSMSPTINDGDTIWVDTSKENIKDGKIFVFEYGGMYMCKRLYRLPNNGLRLVSDNGDEFAEMVITGEERVANEFRLIGWVFHWSVLEWW
jgi:phage repressor protein C with HTH and peptisase S24 domain